MGSTGPVSNITHQARPSHVQGLLPSRCTTLDSGPWPDAPTDELLFPCTAQQPSSLQVHHLTIRRSPLPPQSRGNHQRQGQYSRLT